MKKKSGKVQKLNTPQSLGEFKMKASLWYKKKITKRMLRERDISLASEFQRHNIPHLR